MLGRCSFYSHPKLKFVKNKIMSQALIEMRCKMSSLIHLILHHVDCQIEPQAEKCCGH